jgi:hypothetical protein
MERPKTFEECCAQLGHDPEIVVPAMDFYPEKDRAALVAHAKRIIVTDAINRVDNEGKEWFPDWGNWSEYKYQPWFHMGGSSGSGFACDDYYRWSARSHCGSRLCFKTRGGAKHAAEHFGELFRTEFLKKE